MNAASTAGTNNTRRSLGSTEGGGTITVSARQGKSSAQNRSWWKVVARRRDNPAAQPPLRLAGFPLGPRSAFGLRPSLSRSAGRDESFAVLGKSVGNVPPVGFGVDPHMGRRSRAGISVNRAER